MIWATQAHQPRCPHCNVPIQKPLLGLTPQIKLGVHKIQGMLHTWLPPSHVATAGIPGHQAGPSFCPSPLTFPSSHLNSDNNKKTSPSFWVKGPQFISAKQGAPLDEAESAMVLDSWSGAVLHVLTTTSLHSVYLDVSKHSPSSWTCLLVDSQQNIRLSVSLLRTATVNAEGAFLQDGFALTADRRRHLPRRLCLRCQ